MERSAIRGRLRRFYAPKKVPDFAALHPGYAFAKRTLFTLRYASPALRWLRFTSRGGVLRMTVGRCLLYPALAVLLAPAAAHAQSAPAAFQSPSKNIACQFFTMDDWRNVLRCDIREITTTLSRAKQEVF
jgi:hypothetical protein